MYYSRRQKYILTARTEFLAIIIKTAVKCDRIGCQTPFWTQQSVISVEKKPERIYLNLYNRNDTIHSLGRAASRRRNIVKVL